MSTNVDAITAAALALPEDEREELVARLVESLDGPPDDDVEQAWAHEIARRLEDVRSGTEKGVPWEEVRKRLQDDADGDAR